MSSCTTQQARTIATPREQVGAQSLSRRPRQRFSGPHSRRISVPWWSVRRLRARNSASWRRSTSTSAVCVATAFCRRAKSAKIRKPTSVAMRRVGFDRADLSATRQSSVLAKQRALDHRQGMIFLFDFCFGLLFSYSFFPVLSLFFCSIIWQLSVASFSLEKCDLFSS